MVKPNQTSHLGLGFNQSLPEQNICIIPKRHPRERDLRRYGFKIDIITTPLFQLRHLLLSILILVFMEHFCRGKVEIYKLVANQSN